ncbi:hypothetical protein [Haloplanus aerogenes]|uniref:Uncharacterized protein n=1 Tax=Haloplanus aerogenes TaxID=660522 RepID=A0A3M0CUP1_9EURY|nr:hypothetical protein [Haloplanus aerogenes]AZH26558.1 hypothetical protein DU502_14775 [Haloplanus aerogenes]RMB12787.1 hypothetical protein ATH50_2940 [Haloplanus aerogenes]
MGTVLSLVADVQYDLQRLHGLWMALAFPQLRDSHPVVSRWTPTTTRERVTYRVWAVLGALGLFVGYPLAVLGLLIRFHVRRFDRTATRLGAVGTVLLAALVWGALTALARLRFSTEGFLAVAAAGTVAVLSTILALLFRRIGGRVTTVFVAYPFAVVAVFLPPVVAALYSPTLASVVFPRSETLAIWLLDSVLTYGNLNTLLRQRFELVGFAYVAMWGSLAVPVGWALGLLVTLANLVRPSSGDEEEGDG